MALPIDFVKRMQHLLGAESDALLHALQLEAVTGLRVNTLKLSAGEFETLWDLGEGFQISGFGFQENSISPETRNLKPVPWSSSGFILPNNSGAGKHPYHAAGLYYLQEPSAMTVAEALAPKENELILDLAASPGGKSTHIAALTQNKSIVVANEVNSGRTKALTENLERVGSTHSVITNEEVRKLAKHWGAIFDRVLLDAPCSGEGMFRKSADALGMWSESNVLGCAKRQANLISEAAKLVKVGGYLVYSTCTFAPEENEYVIARFLKEQPEFELCYLELAGTSHGRPEWLPSEMKNTDLTKTVRLFPHQVLGEGHFMAKLQKTSGESAAIKTADFHPISKDVERRWLEFCRTTFAKQPFSEMQLTMFGEKLFAVPENAPYLRGLKALRTGVYLGTFQGTGQKARFEPSHSLALAVAKENLGSRLELAPDDALLQRYMQGHELESSGEDGWLLITISGFPLGWGRRSKNIIKNAYPKALRIAS
jgi:NOL1/NOP2/sun family putative RNA methylase